MYTSYRYLAQSLLPKRWMRERSVLSSKANMINVFCDQMQNIHGAQTTWQNTERRYANFPSEVLSIRYEVSRLTNITRSNVLILDGTSSRYTFFFTISVHYAPLNDEETPAEITARFERDKENVTKFMNRILFTSQGFQYVRR